MDEKRYFAVESGDSVLTKEERKAGWHFCPDWDDMLIGPGLPEMALCTCVGVSRASGYRGLSAKKTTR